MISGLNIFLLVTVASLAIYLGQGQDVSWYQNEVKTKVVPKVQECLKIMKEQVIKPLMEVDLDAVNNETTNGMYISTLARQLNCAIKNMNDSLSEAQTEHQMITEKLNNQVAGLISSISALEDQVRTSESRVQTLTNDVQNAEQQVTDANKALEHRQNDVNAAENDVREAERKVEKARHCFGKRRWRRFWRRVGRGIRRFITNVVCIVFAAVIEN